MSEYLSATDFDKWVHTMLADCKKASGLTPEHIDFVRRLHTGGAVNYAVIEGNFVLSRISDGLRITNIKNGKSASSHRNSVDQNDDKTALAVAWARYRKIDIPKMREYISEYNINNIQSGSIICNVNTGLEVQFIAPDPDCKNKFIAREGKNGLYRYGTFTIGTNQFYVKL